jgi:hypothetical protein
MFQVMPSARALLSAVLCAGMGLAAAHAPVRAAPERAATLCAGSAAPTITCRSCPAADPVVPVVAAAPTRPVAAVVTVQPQILVDDAPHARVLDVAPKTSPPLA